jgi:hypothetical protein
MRDVLKVAFALILMPAWHAPVLAQNFRPTDNPEKFAADVVEMIANGASNDAARIIGDAIGQATIPSTVQSALQVFDGKKFDFTKKVIDNEIGGALRQIIHYSYVEQVGFIYFRFNFKRCFRPPFISAAAAPDRTPNGGAADSLGEAKAAFRAAWEASG